MRRAASFGATGCALSAAASGKRTTPDFKKSARGAGSSPMGDMNASMSDGAILMALSTRMCRKSPSAQSRYTIFVDTWRYAAASLTVSNVRNQSAESSAKRRESCDCVDSELHRPEWLQGCKALLLPWQPHPPSKPWVGGSSPPGAPVSA